VQHRFLPEAGPRYQRDRLLPVRRDLRDDLLDAKFRRDGEDLAAERAAEPLAGFAALNPAQ
jgi:hypothetical protein